MREQTDKRRWLNSFQKRAADYERKGMPQHFSTGSKIPGAAAENFWNDKPFAANSGYQNDSRISR